MARQASEQVHGVWKQGVVGRWEVLSRCFLVKGRVHDHP